MTEPATTPLVYMTLTALDPAHAALRIATTHVGAWGAHIRNPGEPARSFVTTVWGATFEVSQTVAELDAIMGYTAPV